MSRPDPTPPTYQAWEDPFEIDTTVAHAARRYNYCLGGTAQAIDPKARVVYVDNDPIVLAHARRLLAGAPGGATAYIHADLRQPGTILEHADLRATLDLNEPVALMLIAVAHFLTDADDPYGKVARLTGALAPGSHLAMSHGTTDFLSREAAAKFDDVARRESARSREPVQMRDRAAFSRFFDGTDLIPPGIVALPDWRSELPPDQRPAAADVFNYCAVARLP